MVRAIALVSALVLMALLPVPTASPLHAADVGQSSNNKLEIDGATVDPVTRLALVVYWQDNGSNLTDIEITNPGGVGPYDLIEPGGTPIFSGSILDSGAIVFPAVAIPDYIGWTVEDSGGNDILHFNMPGGGP